MPRVLKARIMVSSEVTGTLVKGVVIGGSLGALGAWAFNSWGGGREAGAGADDSGDPLRANALTLLQKYPHLTGDSNMYVALQEPVPLFLQVDSEAVRPLLGSLDTLVSTFSDLHRGSTRPADVAIALRARREASNRLHALTRKARQEKPLLASEIDEDLQTLKKCMDGYIHNCMQQSNLNMMERAL